MLNYSWREALRDDPNNGFKGDYQTGVQKQWIGGHECPRPINPVGVEFFSFKHYFWSKLLSKWVNKRY